MSAPPGSDLVASIVDGPRRVGSEIRWNVERRDGRGRAVLAQLLPELSRDEAVRRRYLRDLERRAALDHAGLAEILDRSGADDEIPWRLRADPPGQTLADWIDHRAPAPIDEVADLGARLADILHDLHRQGFIIRDLHPRLVVLTDDGPVLTDVGLARVNLLSTRTAASLILEGSPYASPEQLRKTVLDQRSDLFGLGVVIWKALTGTLPYGDQITLLADNEGRASLRDLRHDVPPAMAQCIERCVELDAERRPASARDVSATLRGEAVPADTIERVTCQSCGASLRQGQRLCTHCGKQAVVFEHAPRGAKGTKSVVLRKVKEDVASMNALRELLESVSAGQVPALNFIVGDQRMYSKHEQQSRLKLPLPLFRNLEESTAHALAERFKERGIPVQVSGPVTMRPAAWGAAVAVVVVMVLALAAAGIPAVATAIAAIVAMMALGVGYVIRAAIARRSKGGALLGLRAGPAALPASDPLVARLAALVDDQTPQDVRERIGELALAVQRLVDHRAQLEHPEQREVEVLTEPIEPLIGLIESETQRLRKLDQELAELDEGTLVRGLAAAEARGATETERDALHDALERLRAMEDQRAAAVHRLLEAGSLLRRATSLGLGVHDPKAQFDRDVKLALAALQESIFGPAGADESRSFHMV